ANMDYNAIVMQGVAGYGKSRENAKDTAKFLNYYPPIGIFIMSTDVQRGSKLYEMRDSGDFVETTNRENLQEQLELLRSLDVPGDVLYSSGHIVYLVKVSSHMRNREKMVKKLEDALETLPDEILDSQHQGRAI